jgi:nucleoside-diphosphate-sugar epimerase
MSNTSLYVSGLNGFVGSNLKKHLSKKYKIFEFKRSDSEIKIYSTCVIHLAGKSGDNKNPRDIEDFYESNTELTKLIFDAFLESDAKIFITLSSVKAVSEELFEELTEDHFQSPFTHYGKSKLLAEKYILSKEIPPLKRVFILRPCVIHGPRNKGNLNLLYNLVSKGIPWPLGAFENKRSFCSIDNLMFIIRELIERQDIPSGIYNIADDVPISTNELISILAESQNKQPKIWNIPKILIQFVAKIGNVLKLPLNEERLQKLTDSYVVSNQKIKSAIGKPLPLSSKEGLLKTFKSFN